MSLMLRVLVFCAAGAALGAQPGEKVEVAGLVVIKDVKPEVRQERKPGDSPEKNQSPADKSIGSAKRGQPAEPPGRAQLRYHVELLTDLRRADEAIGRGDFDEALRLFLGLLEESGSEWLPVRQSVQRGDVLYVPVAEHLQRKIGSLPQAGLELYRRRVALAASDAERRAVRSGSLENLRGVLNRYRHSEVGPRVAEHAALSAEDAGNFVSAAQFWQVWLELQQQGPNKADLGRTAAVMVRQALCWLNADRMDSAAGVLSALRGDAGLSGAELNIAGRRVPAARYVENRLREAATARVRLPPNASHDWPSLAGDAAGTRRMTEAVPDVSLLPVWRNSSVDLTSSSPTSRPVTSPQERRFQQVLTRVDRHTPRGFSPDFPREQPYPVVVGDRVLVRFPEAIRAYSLDTGKLLWSAAESAVDPNALARAMAEADIDEESVSMALPGGPERGRLSLTVADGRVFAVEDFPSVNLAQLQHRRFVGRFQLRPANRLTARSLESGRLLWSLGRVSPVDGVPELLGEGDKLARESLFLTAPTEADGRLYVTATRTRDRVEPRLFCLSAATGRVIWSAAIGSPWSHDDARFSSLLPLGSPPAVANGVVYATTNAGMLAAYSADQGRPLWYYQYARPGEPTVGTTGSVKSIDNFPGRPPNPIIVAGDRVLFLPADAPHLYVLSADTGELIDDGSVRLGGGGLMGLLARANPAEPADDADSSRTLWPTWLLGVISSPVGTITPGVPGSGVPGSGGPGSGVPGPENNPSDPILSTTPCAVLAGPAGVELVSLRNGRTVRRLPLPVSGGPSVTTILGRPALSEQSVLLPVEEMGLARVSLSDGAVRYSRLLPDVGWRPVSLGPVVLSRGRVISTDSQSVSVYGSYREALARLSAAPDDPEAQLRRGHLAMTAGQIDEAESYFRRAKQLVEGQVTAVEKLLEANTELFAVYVRQAGRASQPLARLGLLRQAEAVADTPEMIADVRLQQAWAHLEMAVAAPTEAPQRVEAGTVAARLAQTLLETDPLPVDATPLSKRAERGTVEPNSDSHREALRLLVEVLARVGRLAYRFADEQVESRLLATRTAPASVRIGELRRLLQQYPPAAARDQILLCLGGAYGELADQQAQRAHTLALTSTDRGEARTAELQALHLRAMAADCLHQLERECPNSPLLLAARVGWVRLEGDRLGVGHRDTPMRIHVGYAAQLAEVIELLGERARTAGTERLQWPPSTASSVTIADTLTALTERHKQIQGLINNERERLTAAGTLPTALVRWHILGGETSLGRWGGSEVRLLADTFGRTLSHNGCVFVRTADSICCVEAATNRLRWRTYADEPQGLVLRNRQNRRDFTSPVGHLYTRRPTPSGKPAPPTQPALESPPPVSPAEGVAMLAVLEGTTLWLVDAQTGRLVWKVDELPPSAKGIPPAARDGILALVAEPQRSAGRANSKPEIYSLVLVDLVGQTVGFTHPERVNTETAKTESAYTDRANPQGAKPPRKAQPANPNDRLDPRQKRPDGEGQSSVETELSVPAGRLPTAAVMPALVPGAVAVIEPNYAGVSVYSVPEGRRVGRLTGLKLDAESRILATHDGMFFVMSMTSDFNPLVAMSATGQQLWRYPRSEMSQVDVAPRYHDGELTVLSCIAMDSSDSDSDGRVVVLSSRTGRLRWSAAPAAKNWGGHNYVSAVARAGDTMFLCTTDESAPKLRHPEARRFRLLATPALTGQRATWRVDLPAMGDADLQKTLYRFFSDGRHVGAMLRFPEGLVDGWVVADGASGKLLTPQGVIIEANLEGDREEQIARQRRSGLTWRADWLTDGILVRETPDGIEVHGSAKQPPKPSADPPKMP